MISAVSGCSSSSPSPTGYAVETNAVAVAGDAVPVSVVQTFSDGSTAPLPAGATVTWSKPDTATALDPGSDANSPLPTFGDDPTSTFVENPGREDHSDDLRDVLFILDAGKSGGAVTVSADITGVTPVAHVSTTIAVSATPDGDATRGEKLYTADCAVCHGATGHGSPANADGKFPLPDDLSDFPAPGLNAEDGNAAGDPDWNAAIFAFASRSDIDDGGVTLRAPMPNWLGQIPGGINTGKPYATQDFADMFAFLATQTK